MGEENMKFAPYIFTIMVFLGVANLLGLIGLTPPTSDYSVTFSLALITFFMTQIMAFKTSGGFGGYLKGFTEIGRASCRERVEITAFSGLINSINNMSVEIL